MEQEKKRLMDTHGRMNKLTQRVYVPTQQILDSFVRKRILFYKQVFYFGSQIHDFEVKSQENFSDFTDTNVSKSVFAPALYK